MPPNYGRLTVEKAAIDADHGEDTNLRFSKSGPHSDPEMSSKFPPVDETHVVVAGGTVGRILGRHSRVARDAQRIASRDPRGGRIRLTFQRSRAILPAGSGTHGVR
jgi:hypothetical protein